MELPVKNRANLILGILTIIFFIGNVSSCGNAFRMKNARNKEMATRLDVEERLAKFVQEKTAAMEKLAAATKELEEEKAAHQVTQKALLQEQMVNQSLKEELAKVTKHKEALEGQLKEAQAAAKSTKSRK